MKAIVVKPGQKDSIHMRDMPDPKLTPDQVAVKMLRVGLCRTDTEINEGFYGKPPAGDEFLILGHENFGVVEEVGKKVKGFKAGDLVVSTVRRPCGHCYPCRQGQNDMCLSGDYTERGIMRRHGFMAEYYVESPQWLNKIPKAVSEIGVLLEPLSVVEKGIDEAYLLQRRLPWKPKTALVLGGGPVGLLAAAVLRVRGLDTHVVGREPDNDLRARLVKKLGATYHTVANRLPSDVKADIPPIDLAIEATGSRERRVPRDADPRQERRAVPAQRHRRQQDCGTTDREDQSDDRPRQPGRLRQRQRQPAPLRDGHQGLDDHRKEMARRPQAVDHQPAAVARLPRLVRSARDRNQVDAGDRIATMTISAQHAELAETSNYETAFRL